MEAFNEAMSPVRASVEWLFGDVSNSFRSIDFKKNFKLGLSEIGKQYIVAALFRYLFLPAFMVTQHQHLFNLIHQPFKTNWIDIEVERLVESMRQQSWRVRRTCALDCFSSFDVCGR